MNDARGHPHHHGRDDRPTGAPWHPYWRRQHHAQQPMTVDR
jgi:hypothetical protein